MPSKSLNLSALKRMLFSVLVMLFLVSCGGGTNSNSSTSINNGVAQKGPFSIGSNVVITKIDSAGIIFGESIKSKVASKSGKFYFETDNTVPNTYYRMKVTGNFFDENTGSFSEDPISLSAITNNPNNSSINILTNWLTNRTDVLLAQGKILKQSLGQSQNELIKLFGINNSNDLDITTITNPMEEDNAMLLLLSGSIMEASSKYQVSSQIIIDEIGRDFADDGLLGGKGDDWFIRLQSLIKDNPNSHTKKYAKNIREKLGYNIVFDKKLPTIIPLASRPVANVPPELLAEPGETITLDGSASHDSGNIINFTWFRVDQQTQYDIQVSDRFSVTPTITVPDEATVLAAPNQEISLLYALVVSDVDKLTHTGVVKVTIRLPPEGNNPPVANSQTIVTDEDTPIAIVLSANDSDGDTITFVLVTPLSTPNGIVELDTSLPNLIYTPTLNYFGSDSFTFIVNDGFANSNTATVNIQVNPVNDPPLADAGADQTAESIETVTLNGSGTDVDGTVEAYLWVQQPGGSLVSLSDPTVSNPSFTSPAVSSVSETLTFSLIVTDNEGADSIADTVDIIINPLNQIPTANAGIDQVVISGELVTLDGSGIDVDGTIDAYQWVQQPSATVSLSDSAISNPSFTAPTVSSTPVTLIFDLIVTDDDGAQSIVDSVEILVNPPANNRPVANAGPDQNIGVLRTNLGGTFQENTAQITLDGSNSSDIEDPILNLTFNWTQLSGPVTIDPADVINPVFNIIGAAGVDIDGDYTFSLEVTDRGGLVSVIDQVTLFVRSNQPPVANNLIRALDPAGSPINITLEADDPDGNNANIVYFIDTLPSTGRLSSGGTFITAPGVIIGNAIVYEPNSISTPASDGFTYIVADELAATSNIATVDITEPNDPPTAHAGFNTSVPVTETATPTSFLQTATINLDGTRSSDNQDESVDLNYQWTQISGPITILPGDIPQVREPSFDITNIIVNQTLSGSYEFELRVTDTGGLVSAIDTVLINASLPNPVVIALPGEDRDIIELTTVQVFGSGSSPMGNDNSLRVDEWKQIDIIPGSEIILVFDPSFELYRPTFVAPAVTGPTQIKLQLVVFDNEFGFSEPAVVTFTIFPTGTVLANDPPTAVDQNIITNANGSLSSVSLMGDDPDGDNLGLTYRVIGVSDPTKGEIASINDFGNNVTVFYRPFYPVLENTLTYVAIDQEGAESAPATVTFTPIVSPPGNTAPVAQDITINIDPPLNSGNSRQLLSYALMIQDAENDEYVINEISKNDTEVQFRLLSGNLRMDNRSRTTPGTGIFEYQAIDVYGNASNIATITINYND